MKSIAKSLSKLLRAQLRFLLATLIVLTLVPRAMPAGAEPPMSEGRNLETIELPPEAQYGLPHVVAETGATVSPKLESSLNQLLALRRHDGLTEAQAFAERRMMVLDDSRVQVVIEAAGDTIGELREAVEGLGGEYQTDYRALLQALVPIDALERLAERSDVRLIREPRRPIPDVFPQVGVETSEGVAASNASAWHTAGHDGTDVRVAVIDSGFQDYADMLGTDLPASVSTYDWSGEGMGGSPHGTACAEIVHDMAPGAGMDLHKIGSVVQLGNAVDQAIDDGVDIVSMSLGWHLDGPGDGTGLLADIVSHARSNGILFIKSAGNQAERAWSGTYNENSDNTHRWASGSNINYFGPGNGQMYVVEEGSVIEVSLHWDDWTGVNQDYDLHLYYFDDDADSWELAGASETRQSLTYPDPVESIAIEAPVRAPYGVMVLRHSATRDVCFRVLANLPLDERVSERSLTFPGDSADAVTVGAVDVSSPYPLEPYSSRGPTFGTGGTCTGGSIKPDIAAYANVSTVSYGASSFAGTSAAAPHVAGAAAVVKGAHPTYTVDQLQSYLESTAVDLGDPDKDNLYGSGRLYLPWKYAVTGPAFDDIGAILADMGYDYHELQESELSDYEYIKDFDAIFINCSGGSSANAPLAKDSLRQFVENGGALYVSDFAFAYIEEAFPGHISFPDNPYIGVGDQQVDATVTDVGLAAYLEATNADIYYDLGGWVPIVEVGPGTQELLRGSFEVNVDTTAAAETQAIDQVPENRTPESEAFSTQGTETWEDKPLAAYFRTGDGSITYTSFHNEPQIDEVRRTLLEYMVLKPITSQMVQTLIELVNDMGFDLVAEIINTVNQGAESWFNYLVSEYSDLVVALGWEGSTLKLSVYAPDGSLYAEEESPTPPIVVEIPGAEPGEWKFKVTGVDVPTDSYPYAVVIGAKDAQLRPVGGTTSGMQYDYLSLTWVSLTALVSVIVIGGAVVIKRRRS